MLNINKVYEIFQPLKFIFIVLAIGIVSVSTLFTNRLANSLALEERKKVEIWAEAIRQSNLADEHTNLDLIIKIIEGNTTIPIIYTDANNQVLFTRNINEPKIDIPEFYKKEINRLRAKNFPIELKFDDTKQYLYYDDSLFLKQLYYFPFIQLSVIIAFILIAFFAFSSTKKAEQNQVWVGLSKETAHQLGTPI